MRGNITDVKEFVYGIENTHQIPEFLVKDESIANTVTMNYDGTQNYQNIKNLNIGENPSLAFSYKDELSRNLSLNTSIVKSNLDVSKVGYYYIEYVATNNTDFTLYFRIVFMVGNPVIGENTIPNSHTKYNYDSDWKDQLESLSNVEYVNGTAQTPVVKQNFTYDEQGNPIKITNFYYEGVIFDYAILEYEGRQLIEVIVYDEDTGTGSGIELINESNFDNNMTDVYNLNNITVEGGETYTLKVPKFNDPTEYTYVFVESSNTVYINDYANNVCSSEGDSWVCTFTMNSRDNIITDLRISHSEVDIFMYFLGFDDLNLSLKKTVVPIDQEIVKINYTYNDQGYRTSKTIKEGQDINSIDYKLVDDKVVYETNGTYSIWYTYDVDGTLISFSYDEYMMDSIQPIEYFYVKNLLGDITKLIDKDGNIVVEYEYDAWGNIIKLVDSSNNNISTINPYTYRGYRYDNEIDLFYLNSRYYSSSIGRFINADGLLGAEGNILGHNMYAYTQNNPVMLTDSTGYAPDWWNPFSWNNGTKVLVGAGIIIALGVATVLTGGAAAGAAGFILAGAFKGAVISASIGAASGAIIGGSLSALSGGDFVSGAIDGAADGFMFGAITGGIGGTVSRISTLSKWNPGTFGSSYESMMYHYGQHGVQTGSKFFGSGAVKYTKDAYSFGIRNASNLKYTYNYKYGNATWNSNYLPTSQGGMFDSIGRIVTFWYN